MNHAAMLSFATSCAETVIPNEITATPRRKQANRADAALKTGERDHSAAERELMLAMQEYRQWSGRMFPTWSEVLEVLQSLGYRKQARSEPAEASSLSSRTRPLGPTNEVQRKASPTPASPSRRTGG